MIHECEYTAMILRRSVLATPSPRTGVSHLLHIARQSCCLKSPQNPLGLIFLASVFSCPPLYSNGPGSNRPQPNIHQCDIRLAGHVPSAGFVDLYRELDLLPDVSIAEEARESGWGDEIYNDIMAKPMRYAVMDDYSRSIPRTPRAPAFLNRDTAVTSSPKTTCTISDFSEANEEEPFDIAEDGHIAKTSTDRRWRGALRHSRQICPSWISLFSSAWPRTKTMSIATSGYAGPAQTQPSYRALSEASTIAPLSPSGGLTGWTRDRSNARLARPIWRRL